MYIDPEKFGIKEKIVLFLIILSLSLACENNCRNPLTRPHFVLRWSRQRDQPSNLLKK